MLKEIFQSIDSAVLSENIQELISDLKATQHGDRINPLYNLAKDYHKEGGVWKHVKLAITFVPVAVEALQQVTGNPIFSEVLSSLGDTIRSATLYHDVGKIVTTAPSDTRIGSYSFPGHAEKAVIEKVLEDYDIELGETVKDLIIHHHDSVDQFKQLKEQGWENEKLAMLLVVKVVDNMAVGPRTVDEAIQHIKPFLDTFKQ